MSRILIPGAGPWVNDTSTTVEDPAIENAAPNMVQSVVDGRIVMVPNISSPVVQTPPVAPAPQAIGTAFHPFERMPVELQITVWRSSAAPRRDIAPTSTTIWQSMDLLGSSTSKRLTHDTAYKRLLCIGDRWGFNVRNMLLGTSRTARIIALEEWKKTVQAMPVAKEDKKGVKEKMEVLSHLTMMIEAWKEKRGGGKEWAFEEGEPENRKYLKRKFDEMEIVEID